MSATVPKARVNPCFKVSIRHYTDDCVVLLPSCFVAFFATLGKNWQELSADPDYVSLISKAAVNKYSGRKRAEENRNRLVCDGLNYREYKLPRNLDV